MMSTGVSGWETYFQTTTFSAGTYFAFPSATLQSTLVVLRGVGIRMITLVAESLLLKFVLTATTYETCVVPISFTVAMTFRGSLTFVVDRYLSSSRARKYTSHRVRGSGPTSSTQTRHLAGRN